MKLKLKDLFLICCVKWIAYCGDFRGGIFMWAPSKDGTYITITFHISWSILNKNHYCDHTTIASGTLIGDGYITCYVGCTGNIGTVLYHCTDYSPGEYSSGTNTFNFTQPRTVKQLTLRFSSSSWIKLLQGGGRWSFLATVDLSVRSDIGKINTSPTVYMPPVLKLQTRCLYTLLLPDIFTVADVDGDIVNCRWATGNYEYGGVCQRFPGSVLNQTACTISYTAGTTTGYYAVALQIEDFANQTSTTPLSSIPLQFLVYIYSGTGCADGSWLVPPTPSSHARFVVDVGDTVNTTIKAQGSQTFSRLLAMSVIDVTRTMEVTSRDSSWSYITMSVTYKPVATDVLQNHTLCFYAKDTIGNLEKTCVYFGKEDQNVFHRLSTSCNISMIGELTDNSCISRSINTAQQTENPYYFSDKYDTIFGNGPIYSDNDNCEPNPCQNEVTCIDGISDFKCICADGFTGDRCSTDIDECLSSPCQNKANCTHDINSYTCSCLPGYAGVNCEIEKDECTSNPCHNGANCEDRISGYVCICEAGYGGINCEFDIDECADGSNNCDVNAECTNIAGSFTCTCIDGFNGNGTLCSDIDECSSSPCRNGASCEDIISGFVCTCETGFDGISCKTDTDYLLADQPSKYTVIVGAVLGFVIILLGIHAAYSVVVRFKRISVKGTSVTNEEDATGGENTSYINQMCMDMVDFQGQHSPENRRSEFTDEEHERRTGESKVYETIY